MNSKRRTSLIAWVQDKPLSVSSAAAFLVAAHAAVAQLWFQGLSPGRALDAHANPGDVSVLFLGGATVAAMVAGLAGVVVVFALSAPGERVRTFRIKGGASLLANWTSAVVGSFVAAGLCLVASFMRLAEVRGWAWVFELAVLLLLHGALRLIWLLRQLSRIVEKEDRASVERDEAIPVEQVVLPDIEDGPA